MLDGDHHLMTSGNGGKKHPKTAPHPAQGWKIYAPWAMALIFVIVSYGLMNAKHSAFNTRTYDFARFAQAVWNSLQQHIE